MGGRAGGRAGGRLEGRRKSCTITSWLRQDMGGETGRKSGRGERSRPE